MRVGFKVLQDRHGVEPAQPLRVESAIGTVRVRQDRGEYVHNQYPPGYLPEDSFAGHFEFGLKYEEIHLEFFARLFSAIGPEPIAAWCRREPYGQYARRTGFLYEWLTGQRLDVPDLDNGRYIDALPRQDYLTRVQPLRDRRWRVFNNLPGTPAFCPLVRRTHALQEALRFDTAAALDELGRTLGKDVLMRSAGWLTLKESRASFLIEKESDQADRIQRFAHVIAQYSGWIDDPLSDASLRILQAGILGHDALGLGLRRSPVFVAQASLREDVIHYIGPHFENVPEMLEGLKVFELATRGAEAMARAAVLAFAFVYIHPMRDGNGRIHRFLVNDTLQRDKAIPADVILPVSAVIASSAEFRAGYEHTLEVFSRPFMRRYAASYRFGEVMTCQDGTRTNFIFDDYHDALFAWRYPDLTEHVAYMSRVIEHTIRTEMVNEARMLLKFQLAQERLKEVIEMPNQDASRIIRSIKDNGWRVSGKLKKEYPRLEDESTASRVVEAVQSVFGDRDPDESAETT
jgi:hypothetical protein